MAVEKLLKTAVLIIFAVLASGSTEKAVGFMLWPAGHFIYSARAFISAR